MPKDFQRTERVGEAIMQELAMLIQRGMKDPRIGMVTVSFVKVSKDLSHAKIFISAFEEKEAREGVEVLNKASGFLRCELAKKLSLRIVPKLTFVFDDHLLNAQKINDLIDKANRE